MKLLPFAIFALYGYFIGYAMGCSTGYCQFCGDNCNECKQCTSGTFDPGGSYCLGPSSDPVCQTCQAGTYSGAGAGSCTECPAGSYSGDGSSSCASCPTGEYSSSSGSSSCTPCSSGSYASVSGSKSCTLCPAGTANSHSGSTSESACVTCGVGYYSAQGATICSECTAGSYSDTTGSTTCSSCPAGTASSTVAASSNSTCSICPAGTASSEGASLCTECPMGSYSSNMGSTSCSSCPSGTYSNTTGLSSCFKCPAGSASPTLAATTESQCSLCSEGFYSNAGSASCLPCSAGYYADTMGSSSCKACLAGTASGVSASTTASNCQTCPAGTYSAAGSSMCSACPTGSFSIGGASACTTSCPAGQGVYSGSSSQSGSSQQCGLCSAGYYNSGNSIYCTICHTGTVSEVGSSSCGTSCAAGYGVANGASSASTSVTTCGLCNPGYANSGNSIDCLPCPLTTFTNQQGATVCMSCPNNTVANAIIAANTCSSTCPAGLGVYNTAYQWSSQSSSSVACGFCVEGYYQTGGTNSQAAASAICSRCSALQYTKSVGASSYKRCTYPYQSFWFDWQTSSGTYYPCQAVAVGLSSNSIAVVIVVLFLFACSFLLAIRNEEGKFDSKRCVVLVLYLLLPIADYLTDIAYILSTPFYNEYTFALSLLAMLLPVVVFMRRLWLRGVRAKFWVWEIPPSTWFDQYDNFYKLLVTAAVCTPYLLVNSPFLIVWGLCLGVFLNGTKLFAIGRVSNLWYLVLTGSDRFATTATIDTQVLNESLYTSIFCESFLQVVAQVVNNTYMNRWTPLGYLSITFTILHCIDGVYRIGYYKLYRKVQLIDVPVAITFGGLLPEKYKIVLEPTSSSPVVTISIPEDSSSGTAAASTVSNPIHATVDIEGTDPNEANDPTISTQRVSLIEMRPSVLQRSAGSIGISAAEWKHWQTEMVREQQQWQRLVQEELLDLRRQVSLLLQSRGSSAEDVGDGGKTSQTYATIPPHSVHCDDIDSEDVSS